MIVGCAFGKYKTFLYLIVLNSLPGYTRGNPRCVTPDRLILENSKLENNNKPF